MKGKIVLSTIYIIFCVCCVHMRATNAQNVKIYYYTEPETKYVVIAPLEISPDKLYKNREETKWKEQAAKIGGKAIIIRIEKVEVLREQGGKINAPYYHIHAYVIRWKENN